MKQNKTIKIILADIAIYRSKLKDHVNKIKNVEIVAEAGSGRSLVRLCGQFRPDIIITAVGLPEKNGIEAAEVIHSAWPRIRIITISTYNKDVIPSIKAGARACLDSRTDLKDLCAAIHAVLKDQPYFSAKILLSVYKQVRDFAIPQKESKKICTTRTNAEYLKEKLSPKEIEVIKMICEGYSNRMMGDNLGLSVRTVENYRESILRKTGETNTASVVVFAIRNKIYDVNS